MFLLSIPFNKLPCPKVAEAVPTTLLLNWAGGAGIAVIVSIAKSTINEFITCFLQILNLRIVFTKFYLSLFIFRGMQNVFFCYDKQFYNGILDRNRKLLSCIQTKQTKFCEIFFVDSGIVKTCDELDLFLDLSFVFLHLIGLLRLTSHFALWPC